MGARSVGLHQRQWAFRWLLHRCHGEWRQNILSLRGDSAGGPERRRGGEEDVPRRADDCWGYWQVQRYQGDCKEHGDLRSESGTQRGPGGGRILDRGMKGRRSIAGWWPRRRMTIAMI